MTMPNDQEWWCDEKYWNNECQEVWHQRALVPAIIAEAKKRERAKLRKEMEGLRLEKGLYEDNELWCEHCGIFHRMYCECLRRNAIIDEVLKLIGE